MSNKDSVEPGVTGSSQLNVRSQAGRENRMKLYAVAAVAAGVGVLALAPPSDAEVVITRKRIPIPVSSYFGTPEPVYISLNNSGVNDFSFYLYSFAYHSARQLLWTTPLEGGAVEVNAGYGAALGRGAKIGSSAAFGATNGPHWCPAFEPHESWGSRFGGDSGESKPGQPASGQESAARFTPHRMQPTTAAGWSPPPLELG